MVDTRFIVQKKCFPVILELRDEKTLTGSVFLHFAKDESGYPETPADLVNDQSRFIVFDEDEEGISFIGKDSILRLIYQRGELQEPDAVENFSASVCITMNDKRELRGDVSALLPEEHARLFDYLNREDELFITIADTENNLVLANKDFINKVTTQ